MARTAHEWEYCFAAQAHEATGRLRGTPGDMETYLQVRHGIADTALTVPAFHSPPLRIMRDIAGDVPMMCNDVNSLEKEEARGDMDNLVLVRVRPGHGEGRRLVGGVRLS